MVDPATTPLGKMLLDEITPVVMVLRTPLVEESCLKNGLSLVQTLSPFCNFTNIDVPVRTASDQPYRLHKFKLRLFYESDIRQPNLEVSKERLKQVIGQAGEKDFSELGSDPPQINNVVGRSESEILPSWFQIFNKELIHSVSFSDHEAFDHPVACLLVVSSKDEQPISKFVDLFNTNKLPSLLNDGAMDPKIMKHYLLVHDSQDGSSEKATKVLSEMRSTFGPNDCHLLCINSSHDGEIEHQDNPWDSYKSDASPSQRLGCFLNIDDFNEIKDLMQELSSKHIIPYMEQKIRLLNQQVSATRKGFRNQIKNLWWRKGKEDTLDSSNGPMYTFSSIESQIRMLGDYAFMLRDYELALSNYRLISTDYKLDKAWKRYAGVQEMMGLTYFMLDQSRKEAEYCMENAFSTYLKIGSSGQQNATRCGLWWVEMLRTRDQNKEAATVYFRICSEEPLHSAVMLEQASYCYLLSKPPMLHKYGFHLVLSGDRYKKCDQIKHAIRTYRSAVSVYKGTTWSHIKDHVHFHIGQWYAFLGMYDVAVAHMLEVLACSHQSKTTQELYLRDFLQIVQKTAKTFEVLKLQLPVINISSLKVFFEDHRTYASAAAASVRESLWSSLEEDIIPSLSTGRSNWLELQSKLISKQYKESNICVAGEPVKVNIEFKNPLQIPISLSSVTLICELSPRSDETNMDAGNSTIELQKEEELKSSTTMGDMSSEVSSFTLSEADVLLESGEAILVQLTVTPKVEGILKIVGVRWKLSGSVVGLYNFETNVVKKRIAKGRRGAKSSPSNDLKFLVIESLPKLEGFIRHIPERAYAGDLQHLILELRNPSEFSVKNLKIKVSHPRFLCVGKQDELMKEFPACLEKKTVAEQSGALGNSSKRPHALFLFPEDITVQGNAPLLWPLWFRAAVPGNISLLITIYYEMGNMSSVIKYRTLRMRYNMQVLPSLNVAYQISPCPSRLRQFLVRMDILNQTSSESFQVHQLSAVGHQWEISLLQPFDVIFPSKSLFTGQALSCFFILKNQGKSLTSKDKSSSLSLPLLESDVNLQASNDRLFDISSSPLADFHCCERSQGVSSQDDPNTVDFILISWLPKTDGVSDSRLFSHHACYCSILSTSPITWLIDGPRTTHHNFNASFCQINLRMTLHNSSDTVASVRVNTFDSSSSSGQSSGATTTQASVPSGNQSGWHEVRALTEIKVTSSIPRNEVGKSPSLGSVFPYIWSGSSATSVRLEPKSTAEILLEICVFSPGTYDLSNYSLNWNLLGVNDQGNEEEGTKQSSGTCYGYPYFLTVLESA
ncbi:trafficking protein particle complex subunit 8-like [Pistacia vera]|uniref:trafficking protein particle complex subunit 8-like n=1 Tax=Pistacia vera TaxID=55513 RepID=UPI001263448F|nr:trafficking protein particle complex subunit 8-like [Pistacia vera]